MSKSCASILSPLLLSSVVLLSACESKWEAMPDYELAAKQSDCLAIADPGPAMIQVCKNYQRECERRREKGIYAC
ncbi:MAG: hypothetical protein WCY88_11610 [Spongiibacteraceae bacterium]|jgi:hypothetical protein